MTLQKLLTSRLGAILIIIPFVKPASELTGNLDILFDIWKIFSAMLIAMGYLVYTKKKIILSKVSIGIFGIQFFYLVSTIFSMGDVKTALVDVASNISLCCYCEYLISKKDIKTAAKYFVLSCVPLAIITGMTMFIYYPNGMYSVGGTRDNYFWGFDNTSAFRFIPTMFFLSIYSVTNNNKRIKVYSLLFFIFCTSAFIYVGSLTAGIMMFMFTIVYLVVVIMDCKIKLINTRNVVIAVVIVSAIIIVYKNDLSQIMTFAGKNDKFGSMSLRFTVWRRTIEQWTKHPLLGCGVEYPEVTMKKLILDHPHNLFLDVLYHGGLFAFIFLIYTLEKLIITKQTATKNNMITAIALLSLLIVAQMDFYNAQYLFYPTLLVGYYSIKKQRTAYQ